MNKDYNENSVREAAYYCWQNAGCPSGKDEYFWNMAVTQLYGSSCSSCKCSKSSASKSTASKASASTAKKASTCSKSKK